MLYNEKFEKIKFRYDKDFMLHKCWFCSPVGYGLDSYSFYGFCADFTNHLVKNYKRITGINFYDIYIDLHKLRKWLEKEGIDVNDYDGGIYNQEKLDASCEPLIGYIKYVFYKYTIGGTDLQYYFDRFWNYFTDYADWHSPYL